MHIRIPYYARIDRFSNNHMRQSIGRVIRSVFEKPNNRFSTRVYHFDRLSLQRESKRHEERSWPLSLQTFFSVKREKQK